MSDNKVIASIALILALVAPIGAYALGLGEASVESFLNQPLDVRMRLLDVSDDDLDSLTVAPASPEDFERLGLMSSSLALGIQIEIDRSVSPAVVRVTSARPVTDPVVQLLVDARWASGRMLREYTLFLDPPTVVVEPPAPAPVAPEQQRPAPADRAESAPARPSPAPAPATETPRRQPSRPVAASGSRSYGPVASGDTLWSIARANLPAGDVSMNQMMIAIVELNPNAFRDRNINQLLRGAELQLPDAEKVRALDEAAAAAEVAAQNRAFRGRMSSDLPVVSSAGRDSGSAVETPGARDTAGRPERTGSADPADPADHRLSLVPPGDEESGSGLSEDAAEVADLRQRLARAEEELYAARQQADEFEARVEDLEAAIRDNPGGIGLRDAELAGLEATLRAAREATREDADPQMRAEVSERLEGYLEQYEAAGNAGDNGVRLASDESGSARGDSGIDGQDDSESAAVGGASPDEADSADTESTPAQERAVTEIETSRGLLGNPMLLLFAGLVALLVIIAIAWIALRRSRASAVTRTPARPAAEMPKAAQATEDPIQAARARVTGNPEDLAAHLALLQTLATDGNQDEFGEALEAMYAHVDSDSQAEWREALDLAGRVVPGHSLVKGSSDWVAEPSGAGDDEPASEVDEESEVDDLMTRLDADLDESDDSDWLGEEDSATSAPDGPLLRDDEQSLPEEESSARDNGDIRFTGTGTEVLDPIDAEDDSPVDFGEWEDDKESALSDRETRIGEGETADDADDPGLDWDADEETQGAAETPTIPSGEPEAPAIGGEDDDIFAQSDDDIDVKLDLAKAYLSWNSNDSARTLLEEVAREGNESQREEARKLLDDLPDGSEDD